MFVLRTVPVFVFGWSFIFLEFPELFIDVITLIVEGGYSLEDILLIKKAKDGDKDALVTLIMNKKNEYYGLALLYMKNQDAALDALEDMILIIYDKIHSLRKPEAFYSWSKRILVSSCLNSLRKNKKLILIEDWDQVDNPSPL